jgi:hypothetical protein
MGTSVAPRERFAQPMKPRRACSTVAALALAGLLCGAGSAHADGGGVPQAGLRLSVDWAKLEVILREGPNAFLPHAESWRVTPEPSEGAESSEQKWFGLSPHLSLVARDWSGAQLLLGHLVLTDQLRLSRSSRMVVTRFRLADGRIAPFAHVGLGQWRVDTDLMPVLPNDVELATQVGGGFEIALSRRATLAVEADDTILIRGAREPQMIAGPHVWGMFLAARARF